jgi:hypothetical protein
MLKKILQLSSVEVKYFFIAVFFLPVMAGCIHIWGVKKTKSKIEQHYYKNFTSQNVNNRNIREARQIGRMVCVAARWSIYRANCLKRALLIWTLLLRAGIQSTLVFGAKKENFNNLDAHAWVEINGEPIGESPNVREHYSVFE